MRQFIIGFVCAAVLFSSIHPATTDERTERSAILEEADHIHQSAEGVARWKLRQAEMEKWDDKRTEAELLSQSEKVSAWEQRLLASKTERAAYYCMKWHQIAVLEAMAIEGYRKTLKSGG